MLPNVRALEELMVRLRHLGSVLLSLDMQDRWGAHTEEAKAEVAAELGRAGAEHREAGAALTALVARLRVEDPAAIAAWADAHRALLDAFIEAQADATDGTPRFVARGELAQWEEVARGERAYVEENVFYVHVDRERYRALFGLDP